MKIVFVCPFINNVFFLEPILKMLSNNIVNTEFDFIALNDAPELDEKSQMHELNLVSILSRKKDCYNEIKDECKRLNVKHIKIPQDIHPWRDFPSHGSNRHAELMNWFNQNFETLYSDYSNVDFLCWYDADLFLIKPTNFTELLSGVDLSFPVIFKSQQEYFPKPSLVFINLKTVHNYKEMDFRIIWKDSGSGVIPFLQNNNHYKILPAAEFYGWQNKEYDSEGKYVKKIKLIHEGEEYLHYYDLWLQERFIHLRWGWGAGREAEDCYGRSLQAYIDKISQVFNLYNISYDFTKWINS